MADDLDLYAKAWTEKMIDIWDEKITMLGIVDTGALAGSLHGTANGDLLQFKFLQYGIYQDSGVGYGYKGHNGDIPFLGDAYRIEHHLDEPRKVGPKWGGGYTSGTPRKPRHWFSRKWFASVMKLKIDMQRIIGSEFVGIVQSIGTAKK